MEFESFQKIPRLRRDCIVTEKIDGTNGQILITEDYQLWIGSRNQWISTPENRFNTDPFGFAKWVEANKEQIIAELGVGRHYGEWWGSGIQRGYGLQKGEKRFSLFNVGRWALHGTEPKRILTADPRVEKYQDVLPEGVGLVPELYRGKFDTAIIDDVLRQLELRGSVASPGFMKPEGIVVFHIAGNVGFKKTIDKDELPKSLSK